MKAEGIPIAVQNEPLNPKNTPSMVMFAKEQDGFLKDHLVGDIISNDEDKRSDSLSPAILLFLGSLQSDGHSGASRQQQIEAHNRQAQQYLKENRADLASAELRAIIALDPNNVDARGNLGVMLFFQGDYSRDSPTTSCAQATAWSVKIEALLGMSEKRTSDAQGALDDLEKTFPKLEEEKIRIEAGMELIEIYNGTGDLDKAAAIVSYRKYKQVKEELRGVYREMRLKTTEVKSDETDPPSPGQPPTQQ
jgi:tetratricopeptide (TPR) repeat protein